MLEVLFLVQKAIISVVNASPLWDPNNNTTGLWRLGMSNANDKLLM